MPTCSTTNLPAQEFCRKWKPQRSKKSVIILAASYLNAISQMLKMVLIPSVPGLAYDMAGAVLDYILIELSQEGETALLIETEFVSESRIKGHFFLLPDPESLRLILNAFS